MGLRPPTEFLCICGKLCTSKIGFDLHQRCCTKAKQAKANGEPTTQKLDLIRYEIQYTKEVQEIADLMKAAALDAHLALTERNRSAGRRARKALLRIGQRVVPLRKRILDEIRKPRK